MPGHRIQRQLMVEFMLKSYARAYGLEFVAFRYFNACGADSKARHGQEPGATHIIARVLESIRDNETFKLYGDDYPTTDGTCIRDYIHVEDLAFAHVLAAKKLTDNYSEILNIGTGQGYSVKEVMDLIEKVIGKKINYEYVGRRLGDPAQTIADPSKALKDLNWQAKLDLKDMISSSWNAWLKHNPLNEK